tara:strand:- start:726 stop:956 length:231 start_codon:yes stop_codon:yes gene_type:complete
MNILKISLGLLFSGCLFAADIPTVDEGADKYDAKMCVERYQNNCITSVCLTSEERDCQDTCLKQAKDKCRQQMGSY